jgi:Xaa-Pro aminopeptidase
MIDWPRCQEAVRQAGVEGWLLFDFQGRNPIAGALAAGLADLHQQPSRRWFALLPAEGEPHWLVPRMERPAFTVETGRVTDYGSRTELVEGLRQLLQGRRRVAVEYSPQAELPAVSCMDAGTLELVHSLGVEVVSSADLVHQVFGRVDEEGLALHRRAAQKLLQLKDEAFAGIAAALREGRPLTEWTVAQFLLERFAEEGLTTVYTPIVAVGAHTAQPHYLPMAEKAAPIGRGELVLLDLFEKVADHPRAVFADITWCGFTGPTVPPAWEAQFAAVRAAREAAVDFLRQRVERGEPVRGHEVDAVARQTLAQQGMADRFIHRTGHNLTTEVHGWGVHLDGYETRDTRLLTPGTLLTVEPGVYGPEVGVRSEINVYVGEGSVEVTTLPLQGRIVPLL